MRYQIAVIGDRETVMGFRLTGVRRYYEVSSEEEARRALEDISNSPDIGIVIITERIAEKVRDDLERIRGRGKRLIPIVIEIPDRFGPMPERRDVVRELIRRAIGVELEV